MCTTIISPAGRPGPTGRGRGRAVAGEAAAGRVRRILRGGPHQRHGGGRRGLPHRLLRMLRQFEGEQLYAGHGECEAEVWYEHRVVCLTLLNENTFLYLRGHSTGSYDHESLLARIELIEQT